MATYPPQNFDLFNHSPSALDSKQSFLEEDEMSVLDDRILDSTSPTSSQTQDPLSHRDSIWSDFAQPLGLNSRHASQIMFNNPFTFPGQSAWSIPRDSDSCTPSALYDQLPSSDFDNPSSAPFSGGAVGGPVSPMHIPSVSSYRQSLPYTASSAVAMSPRSSQGWMPPPADMPDTSAGSPTYRSASPSSTRRETLREYIREGIRKKNARFDIPAERTLGNIDELISQATEEADIKELKQQKRLLRNRQAAYV